MSDLSQQQWTDELSEDDNAIILDVRTEEEAEEGMIPNAIVADIYQGQEFINQIETLDKSKTFLCVLSFRRSKCSSLCDYESIRLLKYQKSFGWIYGMDG